jgi:hypothetical protein
MHVPTLCSFSFALFSFSAQGDGAYLAPPFCTKLACFSALCGTCNALFAFFPLAKMVLPEIVRCYDLFLQGFVMVLKMHKCAKCN